MAPRKKRPKVRGPYWRKQRDGSPARAYGDFRFLGGKREPLCPPGESFATTSEVDAARLYAVRLADLSEGTGRASPVTVKRHGTMARAVTQYVEHRRAGSKATPNWLNQTANFLGRAVAFFGADRQLRTIAAGDVAAWVVHLRSQESGRGGTFGEESIRKHLAALFGLFRRASREGWAPKGYNPVSELEKDERPGRDPSPDVWLEVHDAARLLEAARTYRPGKKDPRMQLVYPLLAAWLLTGGRCAEVTGLDLKDLDFDRKIVHFRPNDWRRLKNAGSERVVPMWPQLEAALRGYLEGVHLDLRLRFDTTLLFPSPRNGQMILDVRKLIDGAAGRAGLREGLYRVTAFRKTYASARLQTLDSGAPVAMWTVARELGHKSLDMISTVYGRLGTVRHRSEVVEYRVEAVAPALDAVGASPEGA